MSQELGLLRAQLNLIQQTLNVVLEKLDRLEEDKKERDELKKCLVALAKPKKKSSLIDSLEKSHPLPTPSQPFPTTSSAPNFNSSFNLQSEQPPLTLPSKQVSTYNHQAHTSSFDSQEHISAFNQHEQVSIFNHLDHPPTDSHSEQLQSYLNGAENGDQGPSSSYFEEFIARAIREASGDTQNEQESVSGAESQANGNVSTGDQRIRQCISCKNITRISGQNKCHKCYMRWYHKTKKQQDAQRKCSTCGEQRDLKTKTQCRACYYKQHNPIKPLEKCMECGQMRKLSGNKRCHPCYMKIYHKARKANLRKYLRVCKACHILKPHYAHGSCEPCYMMTRKDKKDLNELETGLSFESSNSPIIIEEQPDANQLLQIKKELALSFQEKETGEEKPATFVDEI